MASYNITYESKETITGIFIQTKEWIEYDCTLQIKDGGKTPVLLSMVFVPPHPFAVNMPENHSIKAESMSSLYCKVIRFLEKYGIKYEC